MFIHYPFLSGKSMLKDCSPQFCCSLLSRRLFYDNFRRLEMLQIRPWPFPLMRGLTLSRRADPDPMDISHFGQRDFLLMWTDSTLYGQDPLSSDFKPYTYSVWNREIARRCEWNACCFSDCVLVFRPRDKIYEIRHWLTSWSISE